MSAELNEKIYYERRSREYQNSDNNIQKYKIVNVHVQGLHVLRHQQVPLQAAACGSAAGGVAAAITTPLDTIKTRSACTAAA